MGRKEVILKHIQRDRVGLEIGPSHSPVAPKSEGYNVHVVDHADKASLVEKYRPHGVAVECIEDVDFIWRGESYAELTGKTGYYDWIIASHVVEHAPDFISFINNCAEVLKEDGVLSLAIPDARFCFDCFRPLTGISKVVDAHAQKATIHSIGTVVECLSRSSKKKNKITWGYGKASGNFDLIHSFDEIQNAIKTNNVTGEYSDFHAWCFTPNSFRLLIHDLNALGLITMKEVSFCPTRGCEFYVALSRKGVGPDISRLKLMQKIEDELRVDMSFLRLLKLKAEYWIAHIRQKLA